jgi:hypothetical protein
MSDSDVRAVTNKQIRFEEDRASKVGQRKINMAESMGEDL